MFLGVPGECARQAYEWRKGVSDKFLCPWPEHDDHEPSADVVLYTRHRVLKVRCHHRDSKPVGSQDLYALRVTGRYHDLTKAELKLWTLRMLVDMDALEPVAVDRRLLPDDLPEDVPNGLHEVYHGIIEVLRDSVSVRTRTSAADA